MESSPPQFAQWLSGLVGAWYLRTRPRLWTRAFAITALAAIIGAYAHDYTSDGTVRLTIYVLGFAILVTLTGIVALGLPLLDGQLVGLIWRQVRHRQLPCQPPSALSVPRAELLPSARCSSTRCT